MELISREKVLDYLQSEIHFWKDEDEKVQKVLEIAKFEIEELPTIEGRPKGKWKHLGETIRAITLEMHQCSECGYVVLTRSEFNQESYCPNCGANMRGEE